MPSFFLAGWLAGWLAYRGLIAFPKIAVRQSGNPPLSDLKNALCHPLCRLNPAKDQIRKIILTDLCMATTATNGSLRER
jgi:hypothetical protein